MVRGTVSATLGAMTAHWSPLAVVYLLLSICGLIGTWRFNSLAMRQRRLNARAADAATAATPDRPASSAA